MVSEDVAAAIVFRVVYALEGDDLTVAEEGEEKFGGGATRYALAISAGVRGG